MSKYYHLASIEGQIYIRDLIKSVTSILQYQLKFRFINSYLQFQGLFFLRMGQVSDYLYVILDFLVFGYI